MIFSLFLQANGDFDQLYWVAGAAIVLGIVYFLTKKFQYEQRAKEINRKDPRSKISNTSNYNINQEGIDGHKTEGMDAGEAREVVDKMKNSDYIPTDEEFRDLRDDMKS